MSCRRRFRLSKKWPVLLLLMLSAYGFMLAMLRRWTLTHTSSIRQPSFHYTPTEGTTRKATESKFQTYPEVEYWDSEEKSYNYNLLRDSSCVILIWTSTQEILHENWPLEGTKLKGDCVITYHHRYLLHAGVVVFHQSQIVEGILPWLFQRESSQIFVWWSDINPWHLKQEYGSFLPQFNNFFNWTMSHRRDSDIYFPLWRKASLFDFVTGGQRIVDALIRRKNRTAIWIENSCERSPANKARMRYVVRLVQAKFPVDLVGKCFLNSMEAPDPLELSRYRFFLSFVDSTNCSDFFTDQIWIPLRLGIVPVVFGPNLNDAINLLPHHSFIHVSASQSPKDLAQYLFSLEENEIEYRKYFNWRVHKDLDKDDSAIIKQYPNVKLMSHFETSGWTELCKKYSRLNNSALISVPSIAKFALENENKGCLR